MNITADMDTNIFMRMNTAMSMNVISMSIAMYMNAMKKRRAADAAAVIRTAQVPIWYCALC